MATLKAKCPHCRDGCEKCDGGFWDVTMPEDDWYTTHCLNPLCGFDNGGSQGSRLRDRTEPCVMCRHPETVWIPMCESIDNPPWMTHQKDNPFAQYLIALYADYPLDE